MHCYHKDFLYVEVKQQMPLARNCCTVPRSHSHLVQLLIHVYPMAVPVHDVHYSGFTVHLSGQGSRASLVLLEAWTPDPVLDGHWTGTLSLFCTGVPAFSTQDPSLRSYTISLAPGELVISFSALHNVDKPKSLRSSSWRWLSDLGSTCEVKLSIPAQSHISDSKSPHGK